MADKYLIGESLRTRLKTVVDKVEGWSHGDADEKIPTSFTEGPPAAPKIRLCEFTGAWSIGSNKSVNVYGLTHTITVTNISLDVPSPDEKKPCVAVKTGTAWHLVAAPIPTATTQTVTIDVITNVTLGSGGLVFTKSKIAVISTASASSVTIGTTACA